MADTHRPQKLHLGPLETEIIALVWQKEPVTIKDIHDALLRDPDRELAYASVTTVMRRLEEKGWLTCDRSGRAFVWKALVSRDQAQALQVQVRLQEFLALSTPEVVAACTETLDPASLARLEAIAGRIEALRRAREERG